MDRRLTKYRKHLINSKFFASKDVQRKLLDYLFVVTLEKQEISEIDIAEHVFERKDFDAGNDTIVRVNIHKLRQSLIKYYTEEGKEDKIKLSIPKGKYILQHNLEVTSGGVPYPKMLIHAQWAIILLFVILFLGTLIYSDKEIVKPENPLWNNFNFENNTTIVLGTPYFKKITPKHEQDILFVRNMHINSPEEDFFYFSKYFPIDSFSHQEMSFHFIQPNSFYGALPIIRDFASIKNLSIKLLPEYNIKDITKDNLIFVGSIKSLDFFKSYLKNTSFSIDTKEHAIILNDTNRFITNSNPAEEFTDYALCVKIKGETGLPILIIADLHGSGITGIIHLFEQKSILKHINTPAIPECFELLVKLEGVNYTNYQTELVYFKELK
jgi:hypothetical protein